MMKVFNNSLKISSDKEVKKKSDKAIHHLISNNNKPKDVHDSDAIIIDNDDNN